MKSQQRKTARRPGSSAPAISPPLYPSASLQLPLGHLPPVQLDYLQKIKDAMVHGMLLKISDTGIDKGDRHFDIWQTIYLEADYQAHRMQRGA